MHNFLNFTLQFLGLIVALLGVIVAILINWKEIRKTLKRNDIKSIRDKISPTRRGFIKSVGAVSIALLSWGLLQVKPVQESIKKTLYYFLPQGKNLVVNSKSGIIHHKELCADHLPSSKNQRASSVLTPKTKFHGTHKVSILTKVTEGVSAEDAIEILLLAVEDNPTSVHIYDKLVKLLGKLKRYESIHLLLENAENSLKLSSVQIKEGSKERKKYEKAISHIQLQREKARQRAVYSAINYMG